MTEAPVVRAEAAVNGGVQLIGHVHVIGTSPCVQGRRVGGAILLAALRVTTPADLKVQMPVDLSGIGLRDHDTAPHQEIRQPRARVEEPSPWSRSSSVNRRRPGPSCSRRTRFSSWRESMTSRGCWLIQPAPTVSFYRDDKDSHALRSRRASCILKFLANRPHVLAERHDSP